MYIAKIEIKNFRNLNNLTIEFNDGVNVIIGPNNSGKTNILRALGLIFDRHASRLTVSDFSRQIVDFTNPPDIMISAVIIESAEPANEKVDDKNIVSTWFEKMDPPYEARLTYHFFLPETEIEEYEKECAKLRTEIATPTEYWRLIKKKFIRKFVARIYCGNPDHNNRAEPEFLEKFDYQFLDAIRDVEKQMFSGKNPLLKEILDYFLDDEIKKDTEILQDEKERLIGEKEKSFYRDSKAVITQLKDRINLKAILEYSDETGASVGGTPKFEGETSEADLLSALQLLITTTTGIDIPATHNGLGYNNLVHMALLLAKMQMDCSGYVGQENAKVFPMLVIEEPEAHLHPSMQFKFLKFLRTNIASAKQVRQLFITTHSTHITAAVKLEELICMYSDSEGLLKIAYPGRVFNLSNTKDVASKNYIERFLDATKSDMLFANRVLFVEGISEQLLLPHFALCEGKSFEDKHVAVINVGGRYFQHFLKLFDYDAADPFKKNAMKKRVACIADADPVKRHKSRWKKCYPFEIIAGSEDHKPISSGLDDLKTRISDNISVCYNESGKGKTIEFDVAFENPECILILTECLPEEYREILTSLMSTYCKINFQQYKSLTHIDPELFQMVGESIWEDNDKKRGIIAAYYHQAVGRFKGEHALQLGQILKENKSSGEPKPFNVPDSIKMALSWICE